ncbi:FAD-binding and (Fe-S)-binding domain-containing protein [Perlabentimonas gracilis]|uniref:FAD-binding and (Fe-S)-binding domain-containing protein n=1 Tax=Perlabentimonas gracilis TaxID=2715279 RepID=UPI001F44018B|nr:FAD-binding and (Fe-S)-binding domain-containing protein [Perlabentimonas gracilis]
MDTFTNSSNHQKVNSMVPTFHLEKLAKDFDGDVYWDISTRLQYATDASAYREIPDAVALPKTKEDLKKLIAIALKLGMPLIPRTAGTSLAGQVVGKGIIVDMSRYWGSTIELNIAEKWVCVEPGVILDELNQQLKHHGLFFGPETSTSNRCMMGGMVGNNSCGSHSIIYGSTRDHTIAVKMMLDDGNEYEFGPLSKIEFEKKLMLNNREGDLYRKIYDMLSVEEHRNEIAQQFPKPSIRRRNTGYALDLLMQNEVFGNTSLPFNFCNLIAGSEGTLGFITEIKLSLVPLPPKQKALVCVHLANRDEAFKANLIALNHKPGAVELMDNLILECTKGNIEQRKNRFFIQGDPGAVLIVEFARETAEEIEAITKQMEIEMRQAGYGYHFPVIWGTDIGKVWALRKAGLGVLSNIEGDARPVSLVEDTAVDVEDLPNYMADFEKIMSSHNLDCVYHAHIGSGELHLRPVLNLKDKGDVELFRTIAFEVAHLVKKYRGSMSGEHGDGRLRGELIPVLVGDKVYNLMKEVKKAWDPSGIFNPNKIVDTPPNNTNLRYIPGNKMREVETLMDFTKVGGMLRAIEKCNGSGDCRKTEMAGGTMCPSYMATRHEANTTRARANILREFITNSDRQNPFNHKEIYDILDLCLSCKGCKSECPSSVDMAKLKAEFLYQWYKSHRVPLRSWLIANITKVYSVGQIFPRITNFFLSNAFTKGLMTRALGFAPKRQLTLLQNLTLKQWHKKNTKPSEGKKVYLFADEFTNHNDTHIGVKAIEVLEHLGYQVEIPKISESGRTYISKGLLNTAKRIANSNTQTLSELIYEETPLIGIEPSAILSFRDEYPELVDDTNKLKAIELAKHCLLFEEFFMREVEAGQITKEQFTVDKRSIKLHGHCQQKAVASTSETKAMLSFPENYSVEEIPSGCCGMAGAFGYEREHYDLSMKVGELVLFPEVRKTPSGVKIAAPGTSCRHQIKDGTSKDAQHPVEIIWEALKRNE